MFRQQTSNAADGKCVQEVFKMSGVTLKEAQKHLKMWLEAELKIAASQSYTIGTRSLTRANLKEVREQIKFWQNKVSELEGAAGRKGRNRILRAVPRDL